MSSKLYPEEFKIEAVKQVIDRGHSIAEVFERLVVSAYSLYKWQRTIKPDNSEQHVRELLDAKSEIMKKAVW